ncbi:DMT family transporter [Pseudopelagicola sp. nBUS_19]|uniref:DMT family transporter n=1 Tax=Pseudopelagicola sp. nBUS_19 TaxID=3395316 RepID=UPI003EBD0B58
MIAKSKLSKTGFGILLMITTMFFFSVMDSMAKEVANRTDTVVAIWARYAGQTVVVAVLVAPRMKSVLKTGYPGLQLLRSIFLLIATTFFFFGFVSIGLANAAAIMSLNPVLITLGAALILGERFGVRRAIGVGAALIGAIIIIRPGSEVFSRDAMLPLCATVAYSGYAITTRFVGRDEDPWTSLLYTAAFGALVLSAIVPFFWVRPDFTAAVLMMCLGSVGAIGHFCLIRALMIAEASAIAPFSYVGLIFAIFWGMVLFGEYPDAFTYLGALVIVIAGIYVWHRESRTARSN